MSEAVGATTWLIFNLFVIGVLVLDLGVFHRKTHVVGPKEALTWSIVWISLAFVFAAGVYQFLGPDAGLKFFTGYLIEKSLSVDNIFVFMLIFSYFQVPAAYQHRVLFWGILGALAMRATMIVTGAALLERFAWVIYLFGGFLVYSGAHMFFHRDEQVDPGQNPVVSIVRRLLPVSNKYSGPRFFVRERKRLCVTPLFVTLLVVETSDLIFAVDSIPAIFAVTTDPFLVYTSNVFAILGLRALYFLLAGIIGMFRYLKVGLAGILVFVGLKMLLSEFVQIPIMLSFGMIVGILSLAILASAIKSDGH